MPTKYTLEYVKKYFEENDCKLLETEYINQLQKLKYIASCGHNHIICFKSFLKKSGLKCRKCALRIITFKKAKKTLEDKDCKLLYTEEEFNENIKKVSDKIKYIAKCGHENKVCYNNFKTLNQGIYCPKCANKNSSLKLRNYHKKKNNESNTFQEHRCIELFTPLINKKFNIKKLFDGCKADIIIKPNNIDEDKWLGVQVKTTAKKTKRNQYSFRMNNRYNNCLILCICEEDGRLWSIPYSDIEGITTIGIASKSKYNKYEISEYNIIENLNYYYENIPLFSYNELNVPKSHTQIQELFYKNLREQKITFLSFTHTSCEGTPYDFKVNNLKIQEKVGTIMKNNINSMQFHLSKSGGRVNGKCTHIPYNLGDNDFYWLNCKNKDFYVIPEKELCERGFLNKTTLYISPTNSNTSWTKTYKFNYDNINESKLMKLLGV